jgi:hypothetical protein
MYLRYCDWLETATECSLTNENPEISDRNSEKNVL